MMMPVYRSDRYMMRGTGVMNLGQKGRGINATFTRLFGQTLPHLMKGALRAGARALKPAARAVVRDVRRTAVKAGLNVVRDALRGENVLKSTGREFKRARKTLGKQIVGRFRKGMMTASMTTPPKADLRRRPLTPPGRRARVGVTWKRGMRRVRRAPDLFD